MSIVAERRESTKVTLRGEHSISKISPSSKLFPCINDGSHLALQILRSQKDAGKHLKMTGLVHVLLVQARGVMAMDGGTSSDPYCKERLHLVPYY